VRAYQRLPHGRKLEVVSKGERPDYIVIDRATDEEFGVELSSVYIDDRSVPDEHMVRHGRSVDVPLDQAALDNTEGDSLTRSELRCIRHGKGMTLLNLLILSVYVNEYISIYLEVSEFDDLTRSNEDLFDEMTPLVEIVFWPLPDVRVFSVRPDPSSS
jgi:hypothetical protein